MIIYCSKKYDQLFFCDRWDHCIFVCHCAHILVSAIKIHRGCALEYSQTTLLGKIWFFHVLVCSFNHLLHLHAVLCHSPKEGVHLESKGNCLDYIQIGLNAEMQSMYKPYFRRWSLGSVKFFKVPLIKCFSTDFGPKVSDLPSVFHLTSIWSCKAASKSEAVKLTVLN